MLATADYGGGVVVNAVYSRLSVGVNVIYLCDFLMWVDTIHRIVDKVLVSVATRSLFK